MKKNYKSIHGDSPHLKIAQMSHILGVCTASDDYYNNVTHLAQSQAPALEMVRWVWLNSIFLCLLSPLLPHFLSGNDVDMELSSPTSACVLHLQVPESVIALLADEQKAMPCVMSKENVPNCYPWLMAHDFPFGQFVNVKHILPFRIYSGLSYFRCS